MALRFPSKIICPCNRCKKMVLCQHRIAAKHADEWGEWDDSIINTQYRIL